MTSLRRGPLERRDAATLMFGLFVAIGLIIVFAGTLARATNLEAQAEKARSEVKLLGERVAAARAEAAYVKTEAFVEQQARVIGYGQKGEEIFVLREGSPSPRPMVPLGSEADGGVSVAPFDAWMELLFGA